MKTKSANLMGLLVVAASAGALSLFGVASAQAANLIQNGNFATGDLTDWTVSGNPTYTQVGTSVPTTSITPPGADLYLLYVGPVGTTYLTQDFSDVPGLRYLASALIAVPTPPLASALKLLSGLASLRPRTR